MQRKGQLDLFLFFAVSGATSWRPPRNGKAIRAGHTQRRRNSVVPGDAAEEDGRVTKLARGAVHRTPHFSQIPPPSRWQGERVTPIARLAAAGRAPSTATARIPGDATTPAKAQSGDFLRAAFRGGTRGDEAEEKTDYSGKCLNAPMRGGHAADHRHDLERASGTRSSRRASRLRIAALSRAEGRRGRGCVK
jgi:hypothetical protein